MNARQSICLFIVVSIVACAFAGSSPAGTIKLRKLKSRSSDSSRTATAASKQISTGNITSAASSDKFDVTRALIKTAKALARSHSTSEVLTLNLTNLLILVVLKAIIFGIGLFYFGGISFKGGHDGGHGWGSGHGRSLVEKNRPFMSQGELLLIMTYILGAAEKDNYDCLYRVACEDPNQAKDYLNASKMILKGVKYAKKFISYNPKYEDIVRGLQDAVSHKKTGGDCRARYVCNDVPNL